MAKEKQAKTIVFQGEKGAHSHLACQELFSKDTFQPLATFEDTLEAVRSGKAHYAVIPIENNTAGRVSDIHYLLPESNLYIVGEHFLPIKHALLGIKDSTLKNIKTVYSHQMALGQCRKTLRAMKLKSFTSSDTAGAARAIAQAKEPTQSAIASTLAAKEYGLKILREDISDYKNNTTRFLIMAAKPDDVDIEDIDSKDAKAKNSAVITSFIFRVRNTPAALYKALGGFATNGVNMTKLESYQPGGDFHAAQFYADIEGHPTQQGIRQALEECKFFSSSLKIMGVYKASPWRRGARKAL